MAIAFSKIDGLDVTPQIPSSSIRRASLPSSSSCGEMLSIQIDWPRASISRRWFSCQSVSLWSPESGLERENRAEAAAVALGAGEFRRQEAMDRLEGKLGPRNPITQADHARMLVFPALACTKRAHGSGLRQQLARGRRHGLRRDPEVLVDHRCGRRCAVALEPRSSVRGRPRGATTRTPRRPRPRRAPAPRAAAPSRGTPRPAREQLDARHRDDPRRTPLSASSSRARERELHLGARARSGSRRASPSASAARRRRAQRRSAGASSARSSAGSFWRVSASAVGPSCARSRRATPAAVSFASHGRHDSAGSGSRAAPRGARSAGASGRPRRARSSRASRRRSTGMPMSAASRTAGRM